MSKDISPLKRFVDWVREPLSPIDVTYDFATDTPPGRDPDRHSQTLRRYHIQLWSKPLPNGELAVLEPYKRKGLMELRAGDIQLRCSSDAAVLPVIGGVRKDVLSGVPRKERERVHALGRTIGGRIIFPSQQIEKKMTINGARGTNARIRDRFDLTLECIRLGLTPFRGHRLKRPLWPR